MGAPTARAVFEDILPYLGVEKDPEQPTPADTTVVMPRVMDLSPKEAAALLKEQGLTFRTVGEGEGVTAQIPAAGMELPGGAETILYLGGEAPETATVPDFGGMTLGQANEAAASAGLYLKTEGPAEAGENSKVTMQDISPGETVARGTTITLEFTDLTPSD